MANRNIEAFSLTHFGLLDGETGAEAADIYGVRSASMSADIGNFDNNGDDANLSTWYYLNFATITVEGGFIPLDAVARLHGDEITTIDVAQAASIAFTPEATSGDAFDYSGAPLTFTIDDGDGAILVTLNADYTNLAGVVAALDTALPAAYSVAPDGTQVRITSSVAGFREIALGGSGKAKLTGSAGFESSAGVDGDTEEILLWSEDSASQAPMPALARMPARDQRGRLRTLDIVLFKVQFSPVSFTGPAYKSGLATNISGRALLSDLDERGVPLPRHKRAVGKLINRPRV